jgi:hypothetical protein
MGSCQSTPRDVAVSPSTATKEVASSKILLATSTTTEPTIVSDRSTLSDPSSSPQTSAQQLPKNSEPHSEGTEATERTLGISDRQEAQPWQVTEKNYKQSSANRTSGRVPLSKVRPGYSSGGSSDYSDDSEPNASTHNHLVGWKQELAADGDLCKKVVNIEVSDESSFKKRLFWNDFFHLCIYAKWFSDSFVTSQTSSFRRTLEDRLKTSMREYMMGKCWAPG